MLECVHNVGDIVVVSYSRCRILDSYRFSLPVVLTCENSIFLAMPNIVACISSLLIAFASCGFSLLLLPNDMKMCMLDGLRCTFASI